MPVGAAIFFTFLLAVVMIIITTLMDSNFESNHCDALEKRINIDLAYTYNTGCVPVEDL